MEFDKLYDMFQQAGEDWMKSELVIASTSSREHARTGRWKTMSQKEPLLSWKKNIYVYVCMIMFTDLVTFPQVLLYKYDSLEFMS